MQNRKNTIVLDQLILFIVFSFTIILFPITGNLSLLFSIQRCLLSKICAAYQYSAHEKENCILIHDDTQNSKNFVSNEQNQVYEKGSFKMWTSDIWTITKSFIHWVHINNWTIIFFHSYHPWDLDPSRGVDFHRFTGSLQEFWRWQICTVRKRGSNRCWKGRSQRN